MNCVTSPTTLANEVKNALEQSKNGKASSPGEIPAEIIKVTFQKAGCSQRTFVALPKKNHRLRRARSSRPLALLVMNLRIFLKIVHVRIYKKCEENIGETQFGDCNSLGTGEALFALQVLI